MTSQIKQLHRFSQINNVSNEFELYEYSRYSSTLSLCKSSRKQISQVEKNFNSMSEDKYENGIASI